MEALAAQPAGEATIQTLIKWVPRYLTLTEEDRKRSPSRPNEEMWEQRIRNLKSHSTTPGNVIAEGYVEHVGRGRYRLTKAGRIHLGG
jgi:hypothetical protein